MHTGFLQHLFELRAEFHDLAFSESSSSSMVFCWVDLILGHLSANVFALLSRPSRPLTVPLQAGNTLNMQQRDSRLRAVAQLPRQYFIMRCFEHLADLVLRPVE